MDQHSRSRRDSNLAWTSSKSILSRNSWTASKSSSEPRKYRSFSFPLESLKIQHSQGLIYGEWDSRGALAILKRGNSLIARCRLWAIESSLWTKKSIRAFRGKNTSSQDAMITLDCGQRNLACVPALSGAYRAQWIGSI